MTSKQKGFLAGFDAPCFAGRLLGECWSAEKEAFIQVRVSQKDFTLSVKHVSLCALRDVSFSSLLPFQPFDETERSLSGPPRS
jgi:hypothetical protein